VLEIFESDLSHAKSSGQSPMTERARGVAEEVEDLLAPEVLQTGPNAAMTVALPSTSTNAAPNLASGTPSAPPIQEGVQPAPSVQLELVRENPESSPQRSLPLDSPAFAPQDELQLELLTEPRGDLKRAVGESR
jgi:hypothetical protein